MKNPIEWFRSSGQHLCKCIGTKERFYTRKSFNSNWIGLKKTNMAVVLVLLRETNMAAMTSCETALGNVYQEILTRGEGFISKQKSVSTQLM